MLSGVKISELKHPFWRLKINHQISLVNALTTLQFQDLSLLSASELTISLFPALLPTLQMDSFHKSREGESDAENLRPVFPGAMWGTRQPSLRLPCGQRHHPHSLCQILRVLCLGPQPQHLCHVRRGR
ncbi:hypothetical protein NE237_025827 [Protea cynaroides]|uniref:Uncharacterized protein n=1 Tax=Protea cynaroides TaxID=273540 RepID=A0A9Q0H2N7_9MAGN|nr:hypothetical protein NE237_025827 [Protea cynaroides]